MRWYDEQIKLRKVKDQEIFEDSVFGMASAVMGRHGASVLNDERIITKAAIDEILKYYHCKSADIPDALKTPEDQLDYALRPHGIMYRCVALSEDWYRHSFCPMIGYRAEDGLPVVLLPGRFGGYSWHDRDGSRGKANSRTAAQLLPDAICFYSALPLRKIGIAGLLRYMKDCLNWTDFAVLIGLTLLVTLVGMLLPLITKMLTGFVLESGSGLVLWSTAVFMLCVLISSQLLTASRELAMSRLQIKVGVPMEAAMMSRLMALPIPFFRRYSAGELASRSWAVNDLSTLLLGGVCSTGMTAIASLLYISQIFTYAPALGLPALTVSLVLIGTTVLFAFLKMKDEREYMAVSAEESGVSFAIISGIQKIKLSGAIELSNVYFRYQETAPYILNGLDLRIKAGEYVAIVGKTGCGKSTLMRLLLGFEKPEKGTVYFDRKDIRSLDLRSLRRKMGVVTQDGSLFAGDIYSNIIVSAPQLTLDDAWEAAELAGVEALTLDFAGCDYVSSAGLRVLLGTFKQMKASGGDMCLTNVGEGFMEVLENTGLDAVFDVQ